MAGSAKLTRGLTAETRMGFQPWQGPASDRAPVTLENAPVPTYKTRPRPTSAPSLPDDVQFPAVEGSRATGFSLLGFVELSPLVVASPVHMWKR